MNSLPDRPSFSHPRILFRKAFLIGLPSLLLLLTASKAGAGGFPPPPDSLTTQQRRARQVGVGAAFALGYTGGLVLLQQAWYQNAPRSRFHFFNDNREWKQMDKAGHFWSAFHQSQAGVDVLKWAGVSGRKAIWYGGMLGILLQTPIEIFDGYGEGYGASVGDMIANTVGSAAVVAQHLTWGEIRVTPKFSFRTTRYPPLRRQMLGGNYLEQLLKDYNGQTYWLSVDVSAFLPEESRYPKWLNVAAGYGAEEMVYGDPITNRQNGFDAYRQYNLTLDLNLMNIKTRSRFLKKVFYVASIFHLPAPALAYNRRQGLVFHALYF